MSRWCWVFVNCVCKRMVAGFFPSALVSVSEGQQSHRCTQTCSSNLFCIEPEEEENESR